MVLFSSKHNVIVGRNGSGKRYFEVFKYNGYIVIYLRFIVATFLMPFNLFSLLQSLQHFVKKTVKIYYMKGMTIYIVPVCVSVLILDNDSELARV